MCGGDRAGTVSILFILPDTLTGGVFFMQLFSKDAFAFREQFQNLKKVQSICLCGLFVAAYVALSFFSIKMTEFLEFRFAFLALAAAAACGGPVMGMAAGLTGDVISFSVFCSA